MGGIMKKIFISKKNMLHILDRSCDEIEKEIDSVSGNLYAGKTFTKEELLTGMNIELEHGTINPETNVTNDNLILTTKIALAHLNEFPNYYNSRYGLTMFEKFLKEKMNEK